MFQVQCTEHIKLKIKSLCSQKSCLIVLCNHLHFTSLRHCSKGLIGLGSTTEKQTQELNSKPSNPKTNTLLQANSVSEYRN